MAKKRANGEGNIRKRKDGRWEGRYTAGYDSNTGKRVIRNVLGKTQVEVKEKLKAALEEVKGIDVARSEDYTVATWLRTWYELYAKPNVRTATANRYELIIESYTIPRIGNVKLKELTTRHLQKLYKELLEGGRIHITKNQDKGLSTTTVRSVHLMLHPCPGSGSKGAADPPKPQRGLYCAQAPETGHEDLSAGAHPRLPGGRPSARAHAHVLSGICQRPTEGGTGSPAVGGCRHPRQNHLGEQAVRSQPG